MNIRRGIGSALICGLIVCTSWATPSPELPGIETSRAPVIDGRIEIDEWKEASSGEGLRDPLNDGPAPENLRFWLTFDDESIYFAVQAFDSRPDQIVAFETRSNVSLAGNDSVVLSLDVLGSLSDFNEFAVSPTGANSVRIAGGRASKAEWLGEMTSRGRKTDTGWEAEAKIPWSILRLPEPGPRTLRFNLRRYIPRYQRDFFWQLTNAGRVEAHGRWTQVQIPPTDRSRRISFLPYGYLGYDNERGLFNSGVDFRTSLADRIEAVGSINPDFRNIENQILSLDFSYFERLADESRPFFAEGSEYFNTGFGSRLFASQRVDRFDSGVKVFGKPNDRSQFGVMNLTTYGQESAWIGSYTYNPTSRSNLDLGVVSYRRKGIENDGVFVNYGRGVGPYFAYANFQGTTDRERGDGFRANLGLMGGAGGAETYFDAVIGDRDFLPRLGFVGERDLKGFSAGHDVTRTYARGAIMETEWGIDGAVFWRMDGRPYRRQISVDGSLTLRNGVDIDLTSRISRFEQFDDERHILSVEWPRRDRYRRYEYTLTWGHLRGQPYTQHALTALLRPASNVQLSATGQFVRHFQERTQIILSAVWDLNALESVSGRLVRQDSDVNAYVSYRRSGGKGTEYFLILGDPNSRSFRTSLILKVVTPFELRF